MTKRLLAVGLLLTSISANAEWELVYTNSLGDKIFVENDRLTENTDDATIRQPWVLTNNKKPAKVIGKTYMSMVSYNEYDCKSSSSRFIKGTAYSKANQGGHVVVETDEEDEEFSMVTPNTGADKVLQYVCSDE